MLRPVGDLNEYIYEISDLSITIEESEDNPIILAGNINSITILHQYLENILPIIRVTASVEKELYTLLTSSESQLSVQLTIHKFVNNSDIKARELVFSKAFSILNEYDMQPEETKILYGDEVEDVTIKGANTQQLVRASFYLIDKEKLKAYRKIQSLSLENAFLTDAIAVLFSNRGFDSLLMNKIPGDTLGTIIVPGFNLISSLEYINNKYGIFNTAFVFYMDIEENYLLDKTSLGSAVREDMPTSVNIYLEEFSSVESADIGSIINNDSHIINLTAPPVINKLDNYSEFMDGTSITGIDTNDNLMQIDSDDGSLEKNVLVYNKKMLNQIQYDSKEVKQTLSATLMNIDIDAISPNLLYTITSNPKYQEINPISGKYRLNEAMIVFNKLTDNSFSLVCNAILIKLQ